MKIRNTLLRGMLALTVATSTPIALSAQNQSDECSDEVLLSYYPPSFVENTLEKFQVPKSEWPAIKKALAERDDEVVPTVEQRASMMNPNPLKDPSLRDEAVKIFRETLYQFYADVMKRHGITDKEKVQAMLDDIQDQKANLFMECMEKLRPDDREPQAETKGGLLRRNATDSAAVR